MFFLVESTLPLQLGSLFAILAIPTWLFVARQLYKSYKESESKTTKYLSFGLVFGALAVLFLALEQVFLLIFDGGTEKGSKYIPTEIISGYNSAEFSLLFAYLALALSAVAILYFDLFSLSFFEKRWARFLPLLLGLLLFLYVLVFFFTPNEWRVNVAGTDFDLEHFEYTPVLFLLFVFPLIAPVIILLISTYQVRSQSTYAFRRTLLITFAQFLLTIGYLVEILGSDIFSTTFKIEFGVADYAITFGRLFIFIYPAIAYQGINPSERIKRILGA
ncbi:MAG: hypothetical protein HeimC3_27790 [Candidatus Heimdallarchaeota archaeon LC_3]|nr:MAG: hypothetical protein HeimC3_27790 [Candidatus Heimdallarchaeota archaeon LC_3]